MNRRRFILAAAATAVHARLFASSRAAQVELGSIDGSVGGNNSRPSSSSTTAPAAAQAFVRTLANETRATSGRK